MLKRILFFITLFLSVYSLTKFYFESQSSNLNPVEKAASVGLSGDYSNYLLNSESSIVIYTSDKCEACIQLKHFLQSERIQYTEYDVYKNSFVKESMRHLGISSVPVIITNSKLYVGWSDFLKKELVKGL